MRCTRWMRPRAAVARLAAAPLLLCGLATALPAAPGRAAAGHRAPAARPAAVARAVPANFDASERPGNEAENTIAVNPINPRNVAVMTCPVNRVNVAGLFLGVSFDGGATWHRRLFATGASVGHTCDEQLAWDRYGNLWMTHIARDGAVFVGLSTDGGLRFRKVTDIVPTAPKGTRPAAASPRRPDRLLANVADQPFVTVGPGSVWVSYTSVPSGVVQAAGARVTGPGRFGSFTKPQTVPIRAGHGDFGNIAVGPHGQVMVIYENLAGPRRSRVYTALDPDGLGPRGFGRLRLLAHTRVNASDHIPAQQQRGIDAGPKLAWYTGGGPYHGRVYAVWTQAARQHRYDLNTMFRYSSDAGGTWSKAVPLTGAQTVNSQFFPAIAVDQATGDIAVGWYDCRNAQGQGGHGCRRPDTFTQFWAAYSTDGGTRFAPGFQVSRGTSSATDAHSFFDYGDYTRVAFQSHLLYPAWSDNSDSTGTNPNGRLHQLDLYTARVPIR